jgi:uncharacterized membrane protein
MTAMATHRLSAAASLLFLIEAGQAFADFIPLGDLTDGMVVVGQSNSGFGFETFRWTQAGGMVGVGLLPGGTDSFVNGVSADGRVVVGMANDRLRFQARSLDTGKRAGQSRVNAWRADNGAKCGGL